MIGRGKAEKEENDIINGLKDEISSLKNQLDGNPDCYSRRVNSNITYIKIHIIYLVAKAQ